MSSPSRSLQPGQTLLHHKCVPVWAVSGTISHHSFIITVYFNPNLRMTNWRPNQCGGKKFYLAFLRNNHHWWAMLRLGAKSLFWVRKKKKKKPAFLHPNSDWGRICNYRSKIGSRLLLPLTTSWWRSKIIHYIGAYKLRINQLNCGSQF